MQTSGKPSRELMDDVSAVDWLPLEAAVARLSRDHERAFLANVGPLALQAAASARRSQETKDTKDTKNTKAALPVKRRRPPIAPRPLPLISSSSLAPLLDQAAVMIEGLVEAGVDEKSVPHPIFSPNDQGVTERKDSRINLIQRVRRWLRRAM
jgi:8-oxo-dGTP diphosphatase